MPGRTRAPNQSTFDGGRVLATLVVVVLALAGALAIAIPLAFRVSWIRREIEQRVTAAVRDETGLDVALRLERTMWPPGVVVRDLRVASTYPERPFAQGREARVTLRPFSLLSGKVVVDAVEVEGMSIDAELVEGRPFPLNLPIRLKPHAPAAPGAPSAEPPFRVVALTAARIHVVMLPAGATTAVGTPSTFAVDLSGIDVDVDASGGTEQTFDIRLHKASGVVRSPRLQVAPLPEDRFAPPTKRVFVPHVVTDDDTLCTLAANAHIVDRPGSTTIDVHHFEVGVRLDVGTEPGTEPSCAQIAFPEEQIASVVIDHVGIDLPKASGSPPVASPRSPRLRATAPARLEVRSPPALFARYVALPPLGGWLGIALELDADVDLGDPLAGILHASAKGRIEGHELRLDQYRFGSTLAGDLALRPSLVIASNRIDVRYADGDVSVTDVELHTLPTHPDKRSPPLKASVAFHGLTFPGLMRELGVSKAAHVRWDLDEGTAKLAGSIDPLEIDGELRGKAKAFELTARAVESAGPGHIIGVDPKHGPPTIDLATHVAIRPKHLAFESIRARFGNTEITGRTQLGFDNRLEVDVASERFDFSDISPLSTFKLAGIAKLGMKVRGLFGDPIGEGTMSADGFVFDVFPLGTIDSTIARFRGEVIELEALRGHTGESSYEVPSMRIDLGHAAGVTIDALAKSPNLALDDFYGIFGLRDDPRWSDIQGRVGADALAHVSLGTAEDICRTGKLVLDVHGSVLALDLFGERFVGGSADMSIEWFDMHAGGLGMDLDLRAATLRKKGGGVVVTSGRIDRGGRLHLQSTASGVPIGGLVALPPMGAPLDGEIDVVADVGGTFDDMSIDADVNVSPVRIGDRSVGASHVRLARRALPTIAPSPAPDPKGCYPRQKQLPFDLARYQQDAVTGEYSITGALLGGAVRLDDFRVTDQRRKVARGKIAIRDLDLAPLALVRTRSGVAMFEEVPGDAAPLVSDLSGRMSADIHLERFPVDAWLEAEGRVDNLSIIASASGVGVSTAAHPPTIRFDAEGASLETTEVTLQFGDATTRAVVGASIDKRPAARSGSGGSPAVAARLVIPTLPLSRIEQLIPRVERAEGTAQIELTVGGSLASPRWQGAIGFENAGVSVRGLATPITGVTGSIQVSPGTGIRIQRLRGDVGGGSVEVSGKAELEGFRLGDVDVGIVARGVHVRRPGILAAFSGALHASWSPPEPHAANAPARLEGSIDIDELLYERPVKVFDVNAIQTAQRTAVEVYDPLRDLVAFDVQLRARRDLHIRNNLVDATLGVGRGGLRVVGTNQRFGLLGEVAVIGSGRFRLRGHDFEIREGNIHFEDETRIDPTIDVVAVTDFRRATTLGASAEWRIRLHAFGRTNDLRLELSSEPPLSQEDLLLLLTIGMTRAEANQLGGGGVAGGAGIDLLASVAGVDQTLKQAIPVIDDFRFGTAYSVKTGRSEPQITLGKRLTDAFRASVTTGFGEKREVLSNIEWQLSRRVSVQGSYDNVNDVSSSSLGNVGLDLRYRLEFE